MRLHEQLWLAVERGDPKASWRCCGNCVYWTPRDRGASPPQKYQECRAAPPTAHMGDAQQFSRFPLVQSGDWCGAFRAMESPVSVGAVDPHASSTGMPSTRE